MENSKMFVGCLGIMYIIPVIERNNINYTEQQQQQQKKTKHF